MDTTKSVLLFDNDQESIAQIQQVLEQHNFNVELVNSTQQLLTRAKTLEASVVIANPDSNGFNADDVCKQLKQDMGVRVILLIDKNSGTTDLYGDCRADDVVRKPVDTTGFINIIKKHIVMKNS
jgi:DNA-binding response OmpR family regulator